ncbi:MAG TPA: molybdenum cofactor biosynthesis protein MoaE [Acidimicrobiales bacterium]|nr:molybdenum cofactor biosynthesis protein MoaE [Acidimicrobiales bacterium]
MFREHVEAPPPYHWCVQHAPGREDTWVELTTSPLSYERASSWVTVPSCGAVVVFGGTVRDHAEGRPGVSELEYEAYPQQVERRLDDIATEARGQWPSVARIALLHRFGTLQVGECSVLVAVSAPHRGDAFEAARFCIDTLKKTVPIWKRERWDGGEDWGLDSQPISDVGSRVAGSAGSAVPAVEARETSVEVRQ